MYHQDRILRCTDRLRSARFIQEDLIVFKLHFLIRDADKDAETDEIYDRDPSAEDADQAVLQTKLVRCQIDPDDTVPEHDAFDQDHQQDMPCPSPSGITDRGYSFRFKSTRHGRNIES